MGGLPGIDLDFSVKVKWSVTNLATPAAFRGSPGLHNMCSLITTTLNQQNNARGSPTRNIQIFLSILMADVNQLEAAVTEHIVTEWAGAVD